MNYKHFISIILLTITITSCLGDRKPVAISEMSDVSFVNYDFKGNRINYTEGMSACSQISASEIAALYEVSEDMVIIQDNSTLNTKQPNSNASCAFYIKTGENDFEWLRGSMNVSREIGKNEFMGDVAEATGSGEDWEEAWALKKSMSKSSEWIKGLGQAALWNESKTELMIKFEGYTLNVFPIKNISNAAEVAKNRNYREVAISMAKAAGFIN